MRRYCKDYKSWRHIGHKKPHRLRRSCSINALCVVILKENNQFSKLWWQIVTTFYNFTPNLWGNDFWNDPKFQWSYFFRFNIFLAVSSSDRLLELPLQIHPWHVTEVLQPFQKPDCSLADNHMNLRSTADYFCNLYLCQFGFHIHPFCYKGNSLWTAFHCISNPWRD